MGLTDQIPDASMQQFRRESYAGASDGMPLDAQEEEIQNDALKEKALLAIQRLSAALIKKRNVAVTSRAACGIEQIWREDELAFEGHDAASLRTRMIDYATESAPSRSGDKGPRRSQAIINIVRPKCETAEGRFSDIQLPTDGRNWGLLATPVPELSKAIKDERPAAHKDTGQPIVDAAGNPVQIKDIAISDKDIAEEKMQGMEKEIHDQLTECSFNGECRKVIQNATRIGTGILKGPVVIKDIKRAWKKVGDGQSVVRVLDTVESQRPASRSVDPWDCFPDPECMGDIKRAGYVWERRSISPRELRSFVGVDGYLKDQIEAVLRESPTKVSVATNKNDQMIGIIKYDQVAQGSSYELWEYNGDVNREDLEAMGCECGEDSPTATACVVMVNDRPIKATLNPLDTGDLPYDFFVWTARAGVPWGIGVARELMWPQRVLIAAWRAMMDNGGDSSGANIVLGPDIDPMDGVWEITSKKLWRSSNDQIRIDQQFGQFQIQNNQKELQGIIEMALRFADMETQLPMLFNGERGELPETLGATNIIVDSANVALRSRVKLWDDNITRPHIRRYYDWNMQYNEIDDIKGDYKVDPRGTSILKEREQDASTIKEIIQIRQDVELRDMIDWKKAMRRLFSAKNLDILLPEDKITQNEEARNKQPPPDTWKENVAIDKLYEMLPKSVQDQILKKLNLEPDPTPPTPAAAPADNTATELQFKAEQSDLERQNKMQLKMIERDIEAMKLSAASGIALDKIKAELTATAQKLNVQRELSALSTVNKTKTSDVTNPVEEPVGKAPTGAGYQA